MKTYPLENADNCASAIFSVLFSLLLSQLLLFPNQNRKKTKFQSNQTISNQEYKPGILRVVE